MSVLMDALRQSGRTTRMFQKALELASKGKKVIVVLADKKEADMWAEQISNATLLYNYLVPVVAPADEFLTVVSMAEFNGVVVSLNDEDLYHCAPGEEVLVDHAVYEKMGHSFLEGLHCYDSPIENMAKVIAATIPSSRLPLDE